MNIYTYHILYIFTLEFLGCQRFEEKCLGGIQQINISPVMPQLLKSDYFSSTTVDTSENNNINYSNVLPFHLAYNDELDIFYNVAKSTNFCGYNTITELEKLIIAEDNDDQSIISKIDPDLNILYYINDAIVIVNISCLEVERVISSLKNSRAGWDEIPTFVAKKCVYSYLKPLTYLINRSFTEDVFPEELKLARVVPILKAGDPSQIANYRPISVLTFFSKVFEKIMYNCILKFMDDNHVFYEHQYGFRQKHSTQQAIITLVDKIITSLDKGDIVISVFLDLKKAFDTVDLHILLEKLYTYGIRGHIIKWFESYLYDRSQYVIYNNEYSETHPIKLSTLGPLLFIIYVNDICNISNFLFNIMYADDTSVLLSGDDLKDLTCLLNKELELLFIWLKSNKLSLNTQKTFYMLFHRARIKVNNLVVKINDSVLNRVNNMKYLGVIIDHKLKWCEHISYVKNKVSKGLGIIFKARVVFDQQCLLTLYNSFVYPYLIYCIEIWGTSSQIHLQPLFLLSPLLHPR